MNTVTHALLLTIIGMGLVFMALGIFMASMLVLTRLFPDKGKMAADTAQAENQGLKSTENELADIAAIGAALTIWLKEPASSKANPQLGHTLTTDLSPWGIASRQARLVKTDHWRRL